MSHRKFKHPRHGSLGFLPKKRKNKLFSSRFNIPQLDNNEFCFLYSFLGYKVGMTHIVRLCNLNTSRLFKKEICEPGTLIECPPIKVVGISFYSLTSGVLRKVKDILFSYKNSDNHDSDYTYDSQNGKLSEINKFINSISHIRMICKSNKLKKNQKFTKNSFFTYEIQVDGGSLNSKLEFALKLINKKIRINSIFQADEMIDLIGVTKGHGSQGVIKRWGITRLPRKTHRGLRKVACIGAWHPSRVSWTIARGGQMGFHGRSLLNVKLLKVGTEERSSFKIAYKKSLKTKSINCIGGYKKYGLINNDYLLVKGSVMGTQKRPILIRKSLKNSLTNRALENIELKFIDTASKIGHGIKQSY